MRFRFIKEQASAFSLANLCRMMEVSRGGYWSWSRRTPSERQKSDEELLGDIRRIHKAKRKAYGSPRIHRQLTKEGTRCGRKRVERLMRQHGVRSVHRRKFKPTTTDSDHKLPVAPNLLNRQFTWERPNQAWVTDLTYIPTAEGWLYLAAIMDLQSRRIVGWAMGDRIDRHLALQALHMAVGQRQPPRGLLHHSDRGSQYASDDYQDALREYGMICSMSRRGNCWDNAPMESWFHTLKVELLQGEEFRSRREGTAAIFEYMEVFYNRQRIHTALDGSSPEEFENLAPRVES